MRAFMLMPVPGGVKQIPIDLDSCDLDRQIADLAHLAHALEPALEPSLTLDAQVEKLRDAHFELVGAISPEMPEHALDETVQSEKMKA